MKLRPIFAFLLCALFASALIAGPAAAQIRLNEIRIDQPGSDADEYFELRGPASASLSGYWYVIIGDLSSGTSRCGGVELALDLSAYSIGADGFVAFTDSDPGTDVLTGYDVVLAAGGLNFENSDNVTHLLVTAFTGTNGQDLDTNDDGVLDITPWTTVVDAVSLITPLTIGCAGTAGTSEYYYAAQLGGVVVGPDGTNVPGHVYACPDVPGQWRIGPFDPVVGVDTVSGANPSCLSPPPDFLFETRVPCAPLTGETAAITARVLYADAANVSYTVNGGAATQLAMSVQSTSGDTTVFAATLPAQAANGALVEYVVTATNANPDTSSDFQQGYFVGTVPIGSLRVNDGLGANIYEFYGVRVVGNVTVPFGDFADTRTDGYIQDATGGINLFEYDVNPVFQSAAPGDELTVTGILDQYNGKLELTSGGACDTLIIELNGPGSVPAPKSIYPCDVTEENEGLLVKMFYAQIPDTLIGDPMTSNQSLRIKNCGSRPTQDIFLDGDSNFIGNTILSSTYEVTGIVTQFGGLLTGYDLSPRRFSDLTPLYVQVGVGDEPAKPVMQLLQNNPNPFSRTTEIRYVVPQAGGTAEPVKVQLNVFDIQGRRVASLVDALQVPGEYGVNLDAEALRSVGTGVYFYRLEIGDRTITKKLILQ